MRVRIHVCLRVCFMFQLTEEWNAQRLFTFSAKPKQCNILYDIDFWAQIELKQHDKQ